MRHRRAPGAQPVKSNAAIPSCNQRDQQRIIASIATSRGGARVECERLLDDLGPLALCRVLHGMRRWYTANTFVSAQKILPHVGVLSRAMDLAPPVGAYRGFKVDVGDRLARAQEGQVLRLRVQRNGGCSSWTLGRELADRFSGSPAGKVGLVVRLLSGEGVQSFIAPPERCEPWFNQLYARTMGTSHRRSEREYAIYAPRVVVEVVRVKSGRRSGVRSRP